MRTSPPDRTATPDRIALLAQRRGLLFNIGMSNDGALARFLRRNSIVDGESLPFVHTTRAYNIDRISTDQKLIPTHCRHFDEELTYLFVGRPAYKRPLTGSSAEYWELPCCFIFDSASLDDYVVRIYPFDSGAYKDGLYPSYIRFMDASHFECADASAPRRVISAFFSSTTRYFRGVPKGASEFEREFQLGPLDAEVKALRRLAEDGTPSGFDDRRFTVEAQIRKSIDLDSCPPAAVVLPSIYLRDQAIRSRIVNDWKAAPLTYEMYGLSQDKYDAIIYSKVEDYYQSRGLI